jgi:hypothetical protein
VLRLIEAIAMQGTLTHKVNGQIKSLLHWQSEGRSVVTYWDAARTNRQRGYIIGSGCTEYRTPKGKHCNPTDPNAVKVSEYVVGVTSDLAGMGITESTINAMGFATAVPLKS